MAENAGLARGGGKRMEKIIKVMVVGDSPEFLDQVGELLEMQQDIVNVGCGRGKRKIMDLIAKREPDIVLIDLCTGPLFEERILLSRRIRAETDIKTVICIGEETPETVVRIVKESLASGCIFKNQLFFLVENIRAIARGYTAQEYLSASAALSCLSKAEMEVFQIMMGRENTLQSSMKTIANQKGRVVKKLGLRNQKEVMHVFRMFRKDTEE